MNEKMSPKDYMVFLMGKVEDEAARGNADEVIRLCQVGKGALDDIIKKANERKET